MKNKNAGKLRRLKFFSEYIMPAILAGMAKLPGNIPNGFVIFRVHIGVLLNWSHGTKCLKLNIYEGNVDVKILVGERSVLP